MIERQTSVRKYRRISQQISFKQTLFETFAHEFVP